MISAMKQSPSYFKGLNPMQVAVIMEHKAPQVLKRYTHLRAEDLVGDWGENHKIL